jgi:sugar phosphate permease
MKEPPLVLARYLVICWLCLAAAIAYVHRNSLGAAESAVRSDLQLSMHQMGLALSSFFWGYAVFQIPSGWLADRWGTRRLLSLLALTWTVATAATALADGFSSLLALRFIGGSAQAGIFCCATRTISQWFPSTERGITSGLLASSMSAGGALGAMATGILLPSLSWRWILLLYAIPGLLWAAWFYFWFRDRPDEYARTRNRTCCEPESDELVHATEEHSIHEDPHAATPWASLVKSPTMWWIGGQQFFRAAGYIFYASWFATFLQETRHVKLDQAAVLTSLPLWAVVIGSPLGGILSDWAFARTGSRRIARSGVAVASMLGCALLIVLAHPVQNVWLAVLLISAGSFWSALGGPCAYAVTIDVGGSHVGTVFSVMNMCGNVGAAMFPLVVPQLVVATGGWDLVFFSFAGIHIAAGLCWMLVNPNDTIFTETQLETTVG